MRPSKKITRGVLICALGVLVSFGLQSGLAKKPEETPKSEERLQVKADFSLDPTPPDRANSGRVVSYADILERATPSVVSVYTARVVRITHRRYDPYEEMLRRFFGIPPPPGQGYPKEDEIEERKLPAGVGSGVIVSEDGYILTNNHVISDERGNEVDEILVRLNDGRELSAEVVGRDAKTDVALLKVEAGDLPLITMANSENLKVGDVVFAIGNPMGVGQTVTMGIVSATGRSGLRLLGKQAYENFIQTDASINPGNSGGALIDVYGRLVGINTAIISRSGGNIGIGFAIPINLARSIMVTLIEEGTVQRGFLGVNIGDLDRDMAEAFGLEDTQGALVQTVEENLPAAKAGIKRGDVIVAVNGKKIKNAADLRLTIGQTKPGIAVTVTLLREGKKHTFQVKLASLEDPFGAGLDATDFLLKGISVELLDDRLRDYYKIDKKVEGLLITSIEPNSPYARGLREGMVIIEINDQGISNLNQARKALRKGINKLWVYERDAYGFLAIRIP